MAKPEPISKYVVCSECGQPWDDHKKKTIDECVRLLKAELAKRPVHNYGFISSSGGPKFYNVNSSAA